MVATPLKVGAEVEADAPVLVLESMKMETVLRAPFRARLKECLVSVGSQVQSGAPLLRLEPLVAGDGEAAAADLPRPASPPSWTCPSPGARSRAGSVSSAAGRT